MILNVYSIFDVASGAYTRPFFMQSDGQAQRAFVDLVADPESDIGRHPEDYTLIRTATWDDSTCQFHQEQVQSLITGLEAQSQQRNMNHAIGNGAQLQSSPEG